jgi:hypothetical protein
MILGLFWYCFWGRLTQYSRFITDIQKPRQPFHMENLFPGGKNNDISTCRVKYDMKLLLVSFSMFLVASNSMQPFSHRYPKPMPTFPHGKPFSRQKTIDVCTCQEKYDIKLILLLFPMFLGRGTQCSHLLIDIPKPRPLLHMENLFPGRKTIDICICGVKYDT